MGYQARWGPKGFIISPTKIVGIRDLSTSYELKKDVKEDTSGTPPINTKGLELQPINLTTTYLKAAGTDPRGQLEEWRAQVGQVNPLYLNGKLFGPEKLQLQKVDVSDVRLNNEGVMLACTVALSFLEYSDTSTTNAANVKKSTASSNAGAMAAKPSTADKGKKKITRTREARPT